MRITSKRENAVDAVETEPGELTASQDRDFDDSAERVGHDPYLPVQAVAGVFF